MSNITGGMLIAVHEARNACKDIADLEQKVKAAMAATKDHWMETDENNQFRAALAAVLQETEGAEQDRVKRSAEALNKLAAILNANRAGVPVALDAMGDIFEQTDLLPLRGWWTEVTK